jgi:hypothetical protein
MAQDRLTVANNTIPVIERMLSFSFKDVIGPIISESVSRPPFHTLSKPPDEHKKQRHKKDSQKCGG